MATKVARLERAVKPSAKSVEKLSPGSSDASRQTAKDRSAADDGTLKVKPPGSFDLSGSSRSLKGANAGRRVVNAEDLFAVHQQSDRYLSFGNAEKAVGLLQRHIAANPETSAFAYLNLFDIFYENKRKLDYEALRWEFNGVFNGQVPAFEAYSVDTKGLEAYPSTLSRIESLWPKAQVLNYIKATIFRRSGSEADAFTLTAYRELQLLHSVAKRLVEHPQAFAAAADSEAHEDLLHPQHALNDTQPMPLQYSAEGSLGSSIFVDWNATSPAVPARIGLDIDLSAIFPSQGAVEPSLR